MPNRPVLTGNLPRMMHAFDSNASTHNIKPERVLATYLTLGAKTMSLQVYYYLYQGNWFDTAVAATLMTVPVLILSACLQRYLHETNLAGVMR